jgi:hypothetical protein
VTSASRLRIIKGMLSLSSLEHLPAKYPNNNNSNEQGNVTTKTNMQARYVLDRPNKRKIKNKKSMTKKLKIKSEDDLFAFFIFTDYLMLFLYPMKVFKIKRFKISHIFKFFFLFSSGSF